MQANLASGMQRCKDVAVTKIPQALAYPAETG